MNTADHITFDLLPSECKCLLFIAAMGANLKTGNNRRQPDEVLASVVSGFWNDSRLALSDLRDFSGLTNQLCTWITSTRITHK